MGKTKVSCCHSQTSSQTLEITFHKSLPEAPNNSCTALLGKLPFSTQKEFKEMLRPLAIWI